MAEPMSRNLALELARVTEAAALAAARTMGLGDRNLSDQAAVDAMRRTLATIEMDGVVVIGEGEKDEAPMLYIGEQIGNGHAPRVDIAVDPIDGTGLLSRGLPNAISVVAMAERGKLYGTRAFVYMMKLAVGPGARGAIDIERPITDNLHAVARALGKDVRDLLVVMLDRPRHAELVQEIRSAGARLKLITDGDVAGGIMCALPDAETDMLIGVGGAPEAVITACALKCLGGDMQCKPWPRNDQEREAAIAAGEDPERIFRLDDLVGTDDIFFAATGITSGEMLRGVRYLEARRATTQSVVMRGLSGTVRYINSIHNLDKLDKLTGNQAS
jgi:fructose-1,6-bisphosphatase II